MFSDLSIEKPPSPSNSMFMSLSNQQVLVTDEQLDLIKKKREERIKAKQEKLKRKKISLEKKIERSENASTLGKIDDTPPPKSTNKPKDTSSDDDDDNDKNKETSETTKDAEKSIEKEHVVVEKEHVVVDKEKETEKDDDIKQQNKGNDDDFLKKILDIRRRMNLDNNVQQHQPSSSTSYPRTSTYGESSSSFNVQSNLPNTDIHRRRRSDVVMDEDEERRQIEYLRKKASLKEKTIISHAGLVLSLLSNTIETGANALSFDTIKLAGFADNVQAGVESGDFDLAIKAVSSNPTAIAVLENPLANFASTFASILVKTHVDNVKNEMSTGVSGYRARRFKNAKKSRKYDSMDDDVDDDYDKFLNWKKNNSTSKNHGRKKNQPSKNIEKSVVYSKKDHHVLDESTGRIRKRLGGATSAADIDTSSINSIKNTIEQFTPVIGSIKNVMDVSEATKSAEKELEVGKVNIDFFQ